ncbi:amino acid ABC transporter permease [Mesorhizobium sp. A623]
MNTARSRSILIQTVILLIVILAALYFVHNAVINLAHLGLASGFSFLGKVAGFDISFALVPYTVGVSTYGRVLLVGIANTLAVSAIGILMSTILGFAIGMAQLSGNWPLQKLCRSYIEIVRNIPLILQLLFWYTVALASLPSQRQSWSVFDVAFLHVRGLNIPKPIVTATTIWLVAAVIVGALLWLGLTKMAMRRQGQTGRQISHANLLGFGLFLAIVILTALVVKNPIKWSIPNLTGFNFKGGLWLPPEFVALLMGLTLYSSAFIAEIVRGAVMAVAKGQSEAALSLGLTRRQTMRLVIVPQALRMIVPPLTSQYLNLIKNSSLGVAIAYPDIVSVFAGTSLNQTGQAIEIIFITLLFYLAISLLTSGFMNWYNAKIALAGASR